MCTYVTQTLAVDGSAKVGGEWHSVVPTSVYFDHPVHVHYGHALNIDFFDATEETTRRVALELSDESARRLATAILAVLDNPDVQSLGSEDERAAKRPVSRDERRRRRIERRISAVHSQIAKVRAELSILDEQQLSFADDEERAYVDALVSESPAARRTWHEAAGHAGVQAKQRAWLVGELEKLTAAENALLAKLVV